MAGGAVSPLAARCRRLAHGAVRSPRRRLCAARPASQKLKSILIRLASSAGTGYFYAARKNPTTVQHKLALNKYDPIVKQHVLFTEAKMPKGRGGRRAGK